MNMDPFYENAEVFSSWIKNSATKAFFSYLEAEKISLVDRIAAPAAVSDPYLLCGLVGELRRLNKMLEFPVALENAVKLKKK